MNQSMVRYDSKNKSYQRLFTDHYEDPEHMLSHHGGRYTVLDSGILARYDSQELLDFITDVANEYGALPKDEGTDWPPGTGMFLVKFDIKNHPWGYLKRGIRKKFKNAVFPRKGHVAVFGTQECMEEVKAYVLNSSKVKESGMCIDIPSRIKQMDMFEEPQWQEEGIPSSEALTVKFMGKRRIGYRSQSRDFINDGKDLQLTVESDELSLMGHVGDLIRSGVPPGYLVRVMGDVIIGEKISRLHPPKRFTGEPGEVIGKISKRVDRLKRKSR